ncbi:hypothetical protein F0L68_09585 [Solihabitans fulvus]|uniref:Uncharacterized protein n=1 Tax=Solihabitans fulvus TaxID=1892852 RepID=A0A5B2XKT7_9PSEU|nr:hypothetical protein [Solihabitans fulvus]KAA2263725.1 hypothetical protein F0L68_09585 [Solihabitans fulvus]
MSSTPARTAAPNETRLLPSRAIPLPELPAATETLAASAAELLGWRGVVLPPMTLLGRRVVVVAELLPDAHAERLCLGSEPVADRTTVATWVWPEMEGRVPPPAVRLVGVLAVARHWRTGLASSVPFARFGNAATVLPSSVAMTHDYLANCLPRARRYGLSVVTAQPDAEVTLDLAGRHDGIPVEDTAVTRWINEVVYEQVLATASA